MLKYAIPLKYVTPHESQYYIKLSPGHMDKADAFTLIPQDDGWDDVHYLTHPILDSSGIIRSIQYVYILTNISIPGMVKIGMTTTTPDRRAREISSATGVPTPWILVFSFKCYRADLLEKEIHSNLAVYRVNEYREMFSIDSYSAQATIESLGYKYANVLYADSLLSKSEINE